MLVHFLKVLQKDEAGLPFVGAMLISPQLVLFLCVPKHCVFGDSLNSFAWD